MGGAFILLALLLSLFLWMDLKSAFTLLLLLTTLVIGLLGGADDYLKLRYKNKKGASGKKKLLIQGVFSLFVVLYLLWPPLSHALHMGEWFAPPVAKAPQELTTEQYAARLYIPFVKTPILFTGLSLALLGFFMMFVLTGLC